nr:MAG TPA: hypothetical protein [Caudoviricetes sp.]
MLIYEKDGALMFILEQGAQENLDLSNPDITLTKESGKVEILIGSKAIDTNGALKVTPTKANITAGGSTVKLTASNVTGTLKCNKKAEGSTSTGLTKTISGNEITVTATANATAGTWIYTVSDDNDSVDVTFTVTAASEP